MLCWVPVSDNISGVQQKMLIIVVGISDWMSRKYGMMFGSAVFVIGGAIAATAYHGYEWYMIFVKIEQLTIIIMIGC